MGSKGTREIQKGKIKKELNMKANPCSFIRTLFITGVLSLVSHVQTVRAATQFTNEFWLSTSTNTANLGTLSDPFDCSTRAKFDAVMAARTNNCTIHILAGTYQTHGSAAFGLRSGQKILGSGIGNTVIQLASDAADNTIAFSSYVGTNIEICDLTVDCNYTSGNYTFSGISMTGTGYAVRRVKVINGAGFSTGNTPFFGINIQDCCGGPTNSVGNIVEQCEISQFKGGTGWGYGGIAIGMGAFDGTYISGIIRDNNIFLSGTNGVAIQGGNTRNWFVEGNYVDGGYAGFNGDSGSFSNVLIAHNTFKNCSTAARFSFSTRQNLTLSYNSIILPSSAGASVFEFTNNASTNVVIRGNNVTFLSSAGGNNYFLKASSVAGLLVNNNNLASTLTNYMSGCTGLSLYNNFDLQGNYFRDVNQTAPPNGLTRTTVTSTPYNVAYTDRYLGIKTTTTTAINLPSAVGRAGKEFIIAKEVNNGNTININATSPDTISGDSSFGGSYAVRTVISDGTNWFTR
jgi:hypothetical protein